MREMVITFQLLFYDVKQDNKDSLIYPDMFRILTYTCMHKNQTNYLVIMMLSQIKSYIYMKIPCLGLMSSYTSKVISRWCLLVVWALNLL